ncbi:MAG: FMN-binding protein [Defluviitaleaceae bacterium]|nr:FMN-binding protein [Defluviitaleaceae bacterium]
MKKRTKIIFVSVGALIVLLVGAIIAFYPRGMGDIEPNGINPIAVADGIHTGTFERGRFTNTLDVHIENGRIVSIEIINDVFGGRLINASDEVFNKVIAMQDTRINVVSGSTITTMAYLKAIENALGGLR